MKRFGFLVLSVVWVAVSCFEARGAELLGNWPLDHSLENQAASGLRLVPYGSAGRMDLTNECFAGGSLHMDNTALTTITYLYAINGITVTGWFNLAALEMGFSETAPSTLVYLHNSSDPDSQFVFRILDGKLSAYCKSANRNLKTDFMVQEEEWMFFALTLSGDAVGVYQNSYTPKIIPIKNADRYDRLYIGAISAQGRRALKGQMRDLKLYLGALEAGEIKALYESGLPSNGSL